MYFKQALLLFGFLLLIFADSAPCQEKQLLGFNSSRIAEQLELETLFDSFLQKDNLRNWMKKLSARPHHVGSPYGKENAEFIASQFSSWGYNTEIEVFHILFPTPKERILEMIEPARIQLSLVEPTLKEDATSGQKDEQLPIYNAYSIDGDVTGELVYVNQGIPKDYEELDRRGIDVKGKIVIARYGGSWRGIKPKVAAEKGAIGCILYSDPRDDGYYQGDVYPKGSFRNRNGAQRGSVIDMPFITGDPLTPGIGAVKDAQRLDMESAQTLTKIPVMPISFGDALPLLEALNGAVAPENWRGALPITYHIGPGPCRVHLKLEFDWKIVPAYDVIARMEGSERPDEWIIRGNHHDAWVNGANDPISGLVAMMEEARAVGELVKSGKAPKRSIVYAAWDAEEPGLLGSTEWAEAHADILKEKAVTYINTDAVGRGFLMAGGSHTLEMFVGQVARDVIDPQKKISVAERRRALEMVNGKSKEDSNFRLGALGSGSDYTPFIQHLGIASLNIGYGGENRGGVGHSIYDSFDYYVRFGDPKFEYGITLAKTTGRAVLRLANADILPFEFNHFETTVSTYVDEVIGLLDAMREETERENFLIKEGMYEASFDPAKHYIVPAPKEPVPYLNFSPLKNALTILGKSRVKYAAKLKKFSQTGRIMKLDNKIELNKILYQSERFLTRAEGLPRRPWFKHQIYAPGFYTGYGVKTLPGVREAIEERKWKEAEEQIQITGEQLIRFADRINRAAALFDKN